MGSHLDHAASSHLNSMLKLRRLRGLGDVSSMDDVRLPWNMVRGHFHNGQVVPLQGQNQAWPGRVWYFLCSCEMVVATDP